jgi:nucleotide-binding universal stress UspA family protein
MDAKQVVVAYDFSESADIALERAVDIACRAPAHVLHFIAAIDGRRGIGTTAHEAIDFEYTEKIQGIISGKIRAAFERREIAGEPLFFVHARIGRPVHEILELADEVGADMIVIGSHGRTGLRRLFLGSTCEAVVRRARCPVIVARPKGYEHVALDTIVAVEHPPGPRYHRRTLSGRAKTVDPLQWPT